MKTSHNTRLLGLFIRAAAVVVAASLALTACGSAGSSENGDSASGGTLKFGLSAEPATLLAGKDQGTVGYTMMSLIHRGLMAYDGEGKLVPGLAASVETPDTMTYQFSIRDGLAFSDGAPISGDTIKESLDFLRDPANSARSYAGLKDIASVISEGTNVTIKLSQPNSAFLQYLADPTAAVVPSAALAAGAEAWVGAGPFKVDEKKKGVKMTLVRNDTYYDAANVKLDKLELNYYADGSARSNAIISGEVDLIDYVPWEDFDRISSTSGLTMDSQEGPFMYLHFNVTKGPMANPKVREAIAYTINRDNAVKAAFSGHGSPLNGLTIANDDPSYDEDWAKMWSYDPDKAKTLLAEAGYPNGFSATLLTSAQYAFHQDTALSVQADLKAIGIDATLDNPDWATRVAKGNAGDYDIAVSGNVGMVPGPSYITSLVSGPANYTRSFGYSNEDLNAALDGGLRATDPKVQKEKYDTAREIIATDAPLISVATRAQGYAVSDKVKGFKQLPGFLSFYSGYALATASVSGN